MYRKNKSFILKIFSLSIMIVIIFNIGDTLLRANSKEIISKKIIENKKNFKKLNNSGLGNTGIAISTNIGTDYKRIKELPASIYQEIFSISEISENKKAQDELIGKNMIVINEYLNILKTNVKNLINSHNDKNIVLEAYIDQLEYRYINGIKNEKNLIKQKNILTKNISQTNAKIETLKTKITNDFKKSDSQASLENIDTYLELKREYNLAKTYIIYINHFLKQYNFLNNYAKKQASLLLNNKEAIIKDAYIVIPDEGGIQDLSKFNLIFRESDLRK